MQFRLRFLQAKLAHQFLISFNSSNIDYKPYGKAPSSGARLAIHTIFELAGGADVCCDTHECPERGRKETVGFFGCRVRKAGISTAN